MGFYLDSKSTVVTFQIFKFSFQSSQASTAQKLKYAFFTFKYGTFSVRIENVSSASVSITFGVPQGSALGTFLFYFINLLIYKVIFGQLFIYLF